MSANNLKFILYYNSPNTDEPNKTYISKPIDFEDIVEGHFQIDFTDGGYLMWDEIEWEYSTWEIA
jgi:hypothetical protein